MAVGFKCTLKIADKTIGKAKDVDLEMSAGEVDTTVRDDNGWKTFEQGLKEWTASVDMLWVPTDDGVTALRDAYFTGDNLACIFNDDQGLGFTGTAFVTGLRFGQPLEGAVALPVTLRGTGALTKDVTPS